MQDQIEPLSLRVLHVFGSMDTGGAELRTIEVAEQLSWEGIQSHFLTLRGTAGVLAPRITEFDGAVHPVSLSLPAIWRIPLLIRSLEVDAVHSHVATFSGAMLAAARLARVPRRIAHFRSDSDGRSDSPPRRLYRTLMRLLIRWCATDILGVSPGALDHGYSRTWRQDPRARVVPNGIPEYVAAPDGERLQLREYLAIASDSLLLVHVGRPRPEKNRAGAVRAAAAVQRSGHPVDLVLVGGEGPDANSVARAEEQAPGLRVHHLGHCDRPREVMAQADCLILTSDREGLPGVVLESLSTGTAVAAANLPGVRHIADRVQGVTVVPAGASEQDWAAAIVATSALTAKNRHAIRDAFATSIFSLDNAVAAFRTLYREGAV